MTAAAAAAAAAAAEADSPNQPAARLEGRFAPGPSHIARR
jgi:hypothetical protein